MDKKIDIGGIVARIDALLKAGEDARAEKELIEAVSNYTQAEPDDIVGQSVLWNELGSFYRSRRIFDKGEEAFLRAKALLEETRGYACVVEDPAPISGCGACDASGYSGPCCGDGDEGRWTRTEIIYKNESMTANYATILNNLAGLYRMEKQLQKAADTFDRAIEIYEACQKDIPPDDLASVYNNKGLVYLDIRDGEKARHMFMKAKEILEKAGDYKYALGTTLSNLGFVAVIEKKFPEAVERFREAKTLFEQVGASEMAQNCERSISSLVTRR